MTQQEGERFVPHRKPKERRDAPGERMSDCAALHPTYGSLCPIV
jgi:hypothetical protein